MSQDLKSDETYGKRGLMDDHRHQWKRELAIAIISSVTTGGIAVGTMLSKNAELNSQKQNLILQIEAARNTEEQHARLEHQELYLKEIVDHDKAREMAREQSGNHDWSLVFANHCGRNIYLALSYYALDNVEEVTGWYTLEPGESSPLAVTKSRWYYFYAYTDPPLFTWSGDTKRDIDLDGPFEYLFNAEYSAGWYKSPGHLVNKYLVSMSIPEGQKYGNVTTDLYCDAESQK